MSLSKELTGVKFFDARFGGVFAGRGWLLSGPRLSGKTTISLQFLVQGIRSGQRCLLMSSKPAADSAILAAAFGSDIARAIETGALLIMEYSRFVPGRDSEFNWIVPPEGFAELQRIIDSHGIRRVAVNTAAPWLMERDDDLLPAKVFSFVRGLERLQCTFLLTLPRPASAASSRLKNCVEDTVPVSVNILIDEHVRQRNWATAKYLGNSGELPSVPFYLSSGCGAVEGIEPSSVVSTTPEDSSVAVPAAASVSSRPARVRFSSAVLGKLNHAIGATHGLVPFGAARKR